MPCTYPQLRTRPVRARSAATVVPSPAGSATYRTLPLASTSPGEPKLTPGDGPPPSAAATAAHVTPRIVASASVRFITPPLADTASTTGPREGVHPYLRRGPRRTGRSYSRHAMAGSGRDERAWVRRAQAGSVSDFEALFRAHWGPAYRAAFLVVRDATAAEDIAQEAFLSAVRSLDRFDRRRPFGPWLHRIVVNRAIDWARARALRPEAEQVDATAPERPERDDELLRELGRLSPEHRAVIVLRYLLEYTPGEIADLLELPRGTVNSRLRRGLDALKERLE